MYVFIFGLLLLGCTPAPRGAQTTDLAPSRDLSATPGPSAGLPGTPRGVVSAVPPVATAGVPPTYAALGAMVEAEIGSVMLGGKATWYRTPGLTGAAGPVLRDMLGDWRGQLVTVCSDGNCVTIRLTDWCACGERGGEPTLIDLSRSAFARLADPSRGVLDVMIEVGGGPRTTLPPTSTEETP